VIQHWRTPCALARIDEVGIVAIPDIMPVRYVEPRTASIPPRCDSLAEPEETPLEPPPGFEVSTEVPASRDPGPLLRALLGVVARSLRSLVSLVAGSVLPHRPCPSPVAGTHRRDTPSTLRRGSMLTAAPETGLMFRSASA
jgi:hypothetical protein